MPCCLRRDKKKERSNRQIKTTSKSYVFFRACTGMTTKCIIFKSGAFTLNMDEARVSDKKHQRPYRTCAMRGQVLDPRNTPTISLHQVTKTNMSTWRCCCQCQVEYWYLGEPFVSEKANPLFFIQAVYLSYSFFWAKLFVRSLSIHFYISLARRKGCKLCERRLRAASSSMVLF